MYRCILQIICGIIRSVTLIVITVLCSDFIDDLLVNKNSLNLNLIIIISALICLHSATLYLEKKFASAYAMHYSAKMRLLLIRNGLENGCDNLVTYFDTILDNVEKYRETIGSCAVGIFTIFMAVFVAFRIDVILAIIAILPIPVSLFISNKLLNELRQVNNKTLNYTNRFNTDVSQTISAYYELKIFDALPQILRILNLESSEIKNCEQEKNRINSIQGRIGICARFMPQLIIPIVGGVFCYKDIISVGELIAMNLIISYIVNPLEKIIGFIKQKKELSDILIELSDIENNSFGFIDDNKILSNQHEIKFDNVCFSYDEEKDVISNFNLLISEGENILLEGESGRGKTTVIKLLMGILHPQLGNVFIGNHNVDERRFAQALISYMPQAPEIFSASLKDNICLSCDYDEQKFDRIIGLVCLSDFVKNQSDGIDALVGEKGIRLSGGEIKRVALARALYEGKSIYILDEPFAGMDFETMRQVQKNISGELLDSTVIMISHQEISNWNGSVRKVVI